MNKILVLTSVIIIVIFAVFYQNQSTKEITINPKEDEIRSDLKQKSVKKAQELKIEKESKKELKITEEEKKDYSEDYKEAKENVAPSNLEQTNKQIDEDSEYFDGKKKYVKIVSEKKIKEFIEENGLKKVSKSKKSVIYVKNIPQKQDDTLLPPMMPAIVQVKVENKKMAVALDSKVLKANDTIFIEKDNNKGEKELVEVPIKNVDMQSEQDGDMTDQQESDNKVEIMLPPAIGE